MSGGGKERRCGGEVRENVKEVRKLKSVNREFLVYIQKKPFYIGHQT